MTKNKRKKKGKSKKKKSPSSTSLSDASVSNNNTNSTKCTSEQTENDNDKPERGKPSELVALLIPKINKKELKDKTIVEHFKPVFHLCEFKRLQDDEDSNSMLQMESTFIQVVFHDKNQDENETEKEKEGKDAKLSFEYRINSKKLEEEDCQLRNKRTIWESEENYVTKSTVDVLLPLEITPIFTMYPFTIYKAKATIELESKVLENITYRPNIAINTKDLIKNFSVGKEMNELDNSKKYEFITCCPSVQYLMDRNNKEYYKKFSVDFLLIDDGKGKFIKFYFPFFLVCIISSVNALYDEAKHDGEFTFADYISTSSTMALAFVSIIPEAAETTRNQFFRSFNCKAHSILICLGLTFASFPPSFKFPYYKIGILFLWLSFCFPIHNICAYYIIKERMKREACEKSHFNGKGGKFQIDEFEDYEFVALLSDNFEYPNDIKVDEVGKRVKYLKMSNGDVNTKDKNIKKTKGFLYRRPTFVEATCFRSCLIAFFYMCVLFYVMRKSLCDIMEGMITLGEYGRYVYP